ncbi:MAG: DUF3416 domain-containing protein [Actinomycetaceae bacterium]|nr:DUF3416 domain-containing protein [Actinomycetaceae bacterium]
MLKKSAIIARIPVVEVFPVIEDGLWPAKAVVGEAFPIRATCFREGHDQMAAEAVLVNPQRKVHARVRMKDIAPGLDRYEAWTMPDCPGKWAFYVQTWADPYASWAHTASVKISAGVDEDVVLEQGAQLFERALAGKAIANSRQRRLPKEPAQVVRAAIETLRDTSLSFQSRLSAGLHSSVRQVFRDHPLRDLIGKSRTYPLKVDRERALYGAWYEIFPRSYGAFQNEDGTWVSGTLRKAANQVLPRVSQMGFDVIYLTPIHPIGHAFRKGKNNALEAAVGEPGSPYGIGSSEGGHDAIHPDLGKFADFDFFVKKARKLGLEVALDLALQCSPDHPWVTTHPEWFAHRPDGSIAYAENPPKKYQDIYPLVFDVDPEGIYQEIYRIVKLWISHGVTLFRVDNPHTKPLWFWQRLLEQIALEHPDVIFLAEAFTRPAMMRTLGAIGFHQSYTYFAWRTTKTEIEQYFKEVSAETAHLMRPAFWPTTHDILTPQMWTGGIAIFAIRAVLAALGAPTWGIYSGYECVENVPRGNFEENNDNEKYEFKVRDFAACEDLGISRLITNLNQIRRAHPALQRLRNLTIHETTHPNLVAFSRHVSAAESPTGSSDTVLVIVNLDPHAGSQGMVNLDLAGLGIEVLRREDGAPILHLTDLLSGHSYDWGASGYVDLWPSGQVAHIFSVEAL